MNKKHAALMLLVGWLIALVFPPQGLMKKVQGGR